MAKYKHKYRVYVEGISRPGQTYGHYLPDQYAEAKALFDELVSKGYDGVHLQELSLEHGWVDKNLETHITDEFKERKAAYWKRKEEEEQENGWRPGDAPWNAPGMSMSDFF